MPWNKNDYPDAMKNLNTKTRDKAIEIANELLDDNYSEGRAISIAIDRAEKWAGEESKTDTSDNQRNKSRENEDFTTYHLVPHDDKWEIKKENSDRASFTFDTKKEARDKANDMIKNGNKKIVIHRKDGSIEDNISS